MQPKWIILIVNGYGCHLDSPLGKVYLPRVFQFIRQNINYIVGVIYTGGPTQKQSAPGKTEAGVMADFVRSWSDIFDMSKNVILEEQAYTSFENSKFAVEHVQEIMRREAINRSNTRIVHFCEAQRAPLVDMLDRHFLLHFVESIDDITIETASWERADPYKQVRNMRYNKLAIKYPWLGLAEREHRRRLERSKHI